MILQKEIAAIAEQKKVPKSTIEKDWALGHFLDAIFSVQELRDNLVFKGGTCLKKCYFPDYRFSEDLDFTSLHGEFELTNQQLKQICSHVSENAGITTSVVSLLPLKFKDALTGYEAIIKFWGADHPRNMAPPPPDRWLTKVKIEIIFYEQLVFSPETKSISHQFSDKLTSSSEAIPCYGINEILAEKLRSLIQRSYTAPRDFYDIWFLTSNIPNLDFSAIVTAFHEKLKFKNHVFTGIDQLLNPENDKILRSAWVNSLAHQVPGEKFPDYDTVKTDLNNLFEKIF